MTIPTLPPLRAWPEPRSHLPSKSCTWTGVGALCPWVGASPPASVAVYLWKTPIMTANRLWASYDQAPPTGDTPSLQWMPCRGRSNTRQSNRLDKSTENMKADVLLNMYSLFKQAGRQMYAWRDPACHPLPSPTLSPLPPSFAPSPLHSLRLTCSGS